MRLQAHYDALRTAATERLAQGAPELDALLDSPHDTRRGLTLLARPPAAIAHRIAEVLADFQALDPTQYYQPASDLHVTILSIISCYAGFALAAIEPARYAELVAGIVQRTPAFRLRLTGLTASAGAVLVQGFPEGEGLATLRDELRRAFRASGLQQSIDKRYSIQTAHLTVARFRAPLADADGLLRVLARHRHAGLGTWEVRELELVFNDWYQRAAHTVPLARYALARPGP